MLFISGQEIFVIFLIVLLLFGANKMPEIAKTLGKGVREFRKATDDIKREVEEEVHKVKEPLDKEISPDSNAGEDNENLMG